MQIKINGTLIALAGIGAAGALFVATRTATKVAKAVNPLNDKNVFHEAVNATGEAISGDQDWRLGTWIYDITHPNEAGE